MTRHSGAMVVVALALVAVAIWGLTRVPTAFLPDEDQGYLIVSAQLPDGASKERTDAVMAQISKIASALPGVEHVVTVSGISVLDNRASLANAGVAFVVLKDWDTRLKEPGEDLGSIYQRLNGGLQSVWEARAFALLPPPIQGIGNAGGFTMQVEIKNGDFDYSLLEGLTNTMVADANAQSSLRRVGTTFRAGAPQFFVTVDRIKAETLGITVGQVFLRPLGLCRLQLCRPVQQIRTRVPDLHPGAARVSRQRRRHPQAEGQGRRRDDDSGRHGGRGQGGAGRVADQPLQPVPPSATVVGGPAPGFSSGQALDIMEQIGAQALPAGAGYEWTAMSYQEKAVGSQIYYVFGLALLLVYFVLAGQYESWILPLAVILAVPLALLGTVSALTAFGDADNLYTQIGLILLIALGSKNAILIVEYARQQRANGLPIVEAALEAARLRFRPILMTSFAFILGVLPLVLATGAGAGARRSIGVAVFNGMIASTCLVVVFVPSFYVVLQRLAERGKRADATNGRPLPAGPADGAVLGSHGAKD